jgi:hypothetical protein
MIPTAQKRTETHLIKICATENVCAVGGFEGFLPIQPYDIPQKSINILRKTTKMSFCLEMCRRDRAGNF